jgi:hypothetical protein
MDLRNEGRRDGRSWKLPDVITKAGAVGRCGTGVLAFSFAAFVRSSAARAAHRG